MGLSEYFDHALPSAYLRDLIIPSYSDTLVVTLCVMLQQLKCNNNCMCICSVSFNMYGIDITSLRTRHSHVDMKTKHVARIFNNFLHSQHTSYTRAGDPPPVAQPWSNDIIPYTIKDNLSGKLFCLHIYRETICK